MTRQPVQAAPELTDPDLADVGVPLDALDPEGEEPLGDDTGLVDLLDSVESEAPDLEEPAHDLEIGLHLDEPEPSEEDDPRALAFDPRELLRALTDPAQETDEEGIEGLDPTLGIEEITAGDDDATDGVEEGLASLVAEELPDLDDDAGGAPLDDHSMVLDAGARDEPRPPWSELAWSVVMNPPVLAPPAAATVPAAPPGVDRVLWTSTAGSTVALVRRAEQLLLALEASEGRWAFRALDPQTAKIAGGGRLLAAALDATIAFAERDQGIVVSTNGGRAFTPVPGCAGVTALALAERDARSLLFAALYEDSADSAELVAVDLASGGAQRIAAIRSDDDADERSRISGLRWDAPSDQLIATGPFGTAAFVPPRQ